MKKIITILVTGLLLFSILPLAFAGKDTSRDLSVQTDTSVSADNTDVSTTTDTENTAKREKERKNDLREIVKDVKEQTKEFRKEVKADVKELKFKRQEMMKTFVNQKKDFVSKCKRIMDTDDCKVLKQKVYQDAKQFLLDATDEMIEALENVKVRVSESSLENKNELIQKLDSKLASLAAVKRQVEALGDNPTKEQLKTVSGKLRMEWRNSRVHLVRASSYTLSVRLAGLLVRAEHLETKLDKVLAKLEEKGLDTNVSDAKVTEFKQHVAKARELHNQIKTSLQSGASPSDVHDLVKQAQQELKLAQDVLKEAVREIKSLKDGSAVLEETEQSTETTTSANTETSTNEGTGETSTGVSDTVATGEGTASQDINTGTVNGSDAGSTPA